MIGQLIKKDLIHLSCSLRSVLVSWILICLCLPLANIGIAITMPALGGYMLFYSMKGYEERSKGHLLTAALPVKREEICKVQYLEALIFLVMSMPFSIIGLIMQRVMKGAEILPTPMIFVAMFGIGLMYMSVIIPCVVYLGTTKSRYAVIILYGCVVGLAATPATQNLLIRFGQNGRYSNIICFIGIICLMWLLSYEISLGIFKNKDFK